MRTASFWPTTALVAFSCFLASAVAAAAPGAPPSASAAPASVKTKVVGPPDTAWKDLTEDQKAKFMKAVVTPKMKPILQAFDGKKFKTVNCASCHGKNPKEKKFKMPNAEIEALPPTPERFQAKMKAEEDWAKWVKFMGSEVSPGVASLLGLPHFDPKQPDPNAFGCKNCHTLEK